VHVTLIGGAAVAVTSFTAMLESNSSNITVTKRFLIILQTEKSVAIYIDTKGNYDQDFQCLCEISTFIWM
jgi:hypothetical protein